MVLIKTHRDTLLAPLQSVSGIVERRHTLPILSNVLLEKKGDRLPLLATDIEIQITTATEGAGGDGDVVEVEIPGVGVLSNPVRSEAQP